MWENYLHFQALIILGLVEEEEGKIHKWEEKENFEFLAFWTDWNFHFKIN